jgi:hypothetical protein
MRFVVEWTTDKGAVRTRGFVTQHGAWAFAARIGKLKTVWSVTVRRLVLGPQPPLQPGMAEKGTNRDLRPRPANRDVNPC